MTHVAFKYLAVICAFGFSSTYAQVTIDNPYRNTASTDVVFTPDVVADLAGATRVRVELSFQGNAWRMEAARQESGVAPSYPDQGGFLTVALVNAQGKQLISVGIADPRIVRIYEPVPETLTWTRENVRTLRPGRELRDRLEMQAYLPTVVNLPPMVKTPPPGPGPTPPEISKRIVKPTPPESTMRAPALRERPASPSSVPQESGARMAPGAPQQGTIAAPQEDAVLFRSAPRSQAVAPPAPAASMFRADLNQAEMTQLLRTAPQFRSRGAPTAQPPSAPPHMEASVSNGRVVLYLPNIAHACTIRVAVASTGGKTQLTAPLHDFKGQPRCRR